MTRQQVDWQADFDMQERTMRTATTKHAAVEQGSVGTGIQVRPARPEDATRVAELGAQLGYPIDADQAETRVRRLAFAPNHCVRVASVDAAPIAGWIHVFRREGIVHDIDAEIGALIVDVGHRGRGVGSALIQVAADWAAGRGCTALGVRTNVIREDAPAFYKHRGFEMVKQQHVLCRKL